MDVGFAGLQREQGCWVNANDTKDAI